MRKVSRRFYVQTFGTGSFKLEVKKFDHDNADQRCYGVVANEDFILVCEYGCNGAGPKLLIYKKRS